jgi:hypothetical protein
MKLATGNPKKASHEAAGSDEGLMGLPIKKNDDFALDTCAPEFDAPISESTEAVANRLYWIVEDALTGPNGLHSQTFVSAIGTLGGYSARWLTHRAIAARAEAAPFFAPRFSNQPHVSVSKTAERHVSALTAPSFASALVSRLVAAGAGWIPRADTALAHNFRSMADAELPDYTVPAQHWPQCSVHSILIMLWEPVRRELSARDLPDHVIMQAFGLAAADAALDHRNTVPPAVAAQLALETAIAASRLDYAF